MATENEDTAGQEPVYERAENYIEVYFNHAQLGFTGFDIYGFLSETAHDMHGRLVVRQKARIAMSPKEAKLLAFYLANAVSRYEAAYGPVNMVGVEETSDAG